MDPSAAIRIEALSKTYAGGKQALDNATFDAIRRVHDGTFKGGVYSFGLKEGGVGYVYDEHNRALIPDAVRARLEKIKQDIIDGKIKVPSER